MNPLHWKREHRIALAIVIFIGSVIGVTIGLFAVEPSGHIWVWSSANSNDPLRSWDRSHHHINTYWLWIALWGVFGGIAGAATIYVPKLLRS